MLVRKKCDGKIELNRLAPGDTFVTDSGYYIVTCASSKRDHLLTVHLESGTVEYHHYDLRVSKVELVAITSDELSMLLGG